MAEHDMDSRELESAALERAGLVLRFDRLDGGELVALHTHEGRTIAAVVHPERGSWIVPGVTVRPWSLAGDVDPVRRPRGHAKAATTACGEAAEALGRELGIEIDGWTL